MFSYLTNVVKKGIPILTWSKTYSWEIALADLVAGITIGLTLIPQCIAYASLAGLGPQYGLYSSLCGGIIYVAFGGVPELSIAPTALLSLLTYSFTNDVTFGNAHAAILLCFLSGVVELLCGILHIGFLVDFVSTPVVAAFTSAGAITIASSQVKNLLGLDFNADGFIEVWSHIFNKITESRQWDIILGVVCCIILLLLRKLKDCGVPPLDEPKLEKPTSHGKKIIWFCSVGRNAFVVIGCAIAAYILKEYNNTPFSLTSKVPSGLPKFIVPVGTIHYRNETITVVDMIREVGIGIFVVPFVAILGNVAIAKSFAKGKVIDASQEMVAVGMCNLVGSFFGSYPISASFSRAAVSNASGVRTPLAGIYAGGMVMLALTFLTPYFSYIPKATLAAVIICAVIFMVEVSLTKMIWEINKIDLVPFIVTFVSCLVLRIEIGILVGIGIDILFLLYRAARPDVIIERINNDAGTSYAKITLTTSIFFPSAEYIREKVLKTKLILPSDKYVIFDLQKINGFDFTSLKCIGALIGDLKKIDKRPVFYRPQTKAANLLKKVTDGLVKIADDDNVLNEIITDGGGGTLRAVEISMNGKDVASTQL